MLLKFSFNENLFINLQNTRCNEIGDNGAI